MAKLYCILARSADVGVIFRRGPSRQVRLIRWNLATHTFDAGQWFRGRLYERKSDLSPNGRKLVYFAAKYKGDLPTWIGVSSPPFLTAHVIWKGVGTWNDISLFDNDRSLALGVYSDVLPLPQPGFSVPAGLSVRAKPWPGYFYKFPEHDRLSRDGWIIASGNPIYSGRGSQAHSQVVYRKPFSADQFLEMKGTGETDFEYSVICDSGDIKPLNADWADIHGHQLLYSIGGKLMQANFRTHRKSIEFSEIRELADFSEMKFENIEAPSWASRW